MVFFVVFTVDCLEGRKRFGLFVGFFSLHCSVSMFDTTLPFALELR